MYWPRILPSMVYSGCQPKVFGYFETLFQQLQPLETNRSGTFSELM